jgi:hypothetical protein
MREVKNLLNNKTHISKITLRKAAILFQILEISYRRVIHLAGATSYIGHDDENSIKAVWQLLSLAQHHYQTLVKTLYELTGIPVALNLTNRDENVDHDFASILQKEASYQQDTLKLLERAIEVFGEEQELADTLSSTRKELLEIKKRMKHFVPSQAHSVEKVEFAKVSEKTESRIQASISKN